MKARQLRKPLGLICLVLGAFAVFFGVVSLGLNPGQAWTTIIMGLVALTIGMVALMLARRDHREGL